MIKNIVSVIFFGLCLIQIAWAKAQVPRLSGPVIDQVGLVTRSDERYLESLLRDYNSKGAAQIQVLLVDSLEGETIEAYSLRVVDTWKLGSAKQDNGILFLIAVGDRKMRIEVGQGLEGALPDVVAKRIIEDLVSPLFRAQRFSDGVVAGVSEIIHQVDAEYAAGHLKAAPAKKKKPGLPLLIFITLILISVGRMRIPLVNSPFLDPRSGGARGWGGRGGFGGGGWSGGGGGFSGGGASGGW